MKQAMLRTDKQSISSEKIWLTDWLSEEVKKKNVSNTNAIRSVRRKARKIHTQTKSI